MSVIGSGHVWDRLNKLEFGDYSGNGVGGILSMPTLGENGDADVEEMSAGRCL
jgi:hypothetical protein